MDTYSKLLGLGDKPENPPSNQPNEEKSSVPTSEEKKGQSATIIEKKLPSPTLQVKEKKKQATKKIEQGKTQISAWITEEDQTTFQSLYHTWNGKGIKIEKGELVGLAIKTLFQVAGKIPDNSSSLEELEMKLRKKIESSKDS
jgi:hypothetical protein